MSLLSSNKLLFNYDHLSYLGSVTSNNVSLNKSIMSNKSKVLTTVQQCQTLKKDNDSRQPKSKASKLVLRELQC